MSERSIDALNSKVPSSPTKVGNLTRRKSVMNLGFNSSPTRRESTYSIKQQGASTNGPFECASPEKGFK